MFFFHMGIRLLFWISTSFWMLRTPRLVSRFFLFWTISYLFSKKQKKMQKNQCLSSSLKLVDTQSLFIRWTWHPACCHRLSIRSYQTLLELYFHSQICFPPQGSPCSPSHSKTHTHWLPRHPYHCGLLNPLHSHN